MAKKERDEKKEMVNKARAQPGKKNSKEGSEEKESNTKVWEKAKKYKENTRQPQIVDKGIYIGVGKIKQV